MKQVLFGARDMTGKKTEKLKLFEIFLKAENKFRIQKEKTLYSWKDQERCQEIDSVCDRYVKEEYD